MLESSPPQSTNARSLWSRILIIVGSIAMVVGALDPMEGSVVILPGSGLVALGTFFNPSDRRWIGYRVLVFILIGIGVGAMFWLTSVGGFGGHSKYSMWWGLLILPYLIGWSMGIWGPGSQRWLLVAGIVVGLFYQAIPVIVIVQTHRGLRPGMAAGLLAPLILSALGVLTIVGCIVRLRIQSRHGA